MKTPRLSRSKTNHDGPPSSKSNKSQSSPATPELTFRTSFDELRRPENRQMLRQHLTGHFPESSTPNSKAYATEDDLNARQKLSRSQSSLMVPQIPTAGSSSLSLNTLGDKRLSTVRETTQTIDIEQAINLLQELKKTASPDQLVALHKALLPTRDSTVSLQSSLPVNEDRLSGSGAPPARHRSLHPAGLATRGGPADDLLKKQDDHFSLAKVRDILRDDWGGPVTPHRSRTDPVSGRDDVALDQHDLRASTPTDSEYGNTGIHRRGTLRITNGAASPDPSVSMRSIDIRDKPNIRSSEDVISESLSSTPKHDRPSEEWFSTRESVEASPAEEIQQPSWDTPNAELAGDELDEVNEVAASEGENASSSGLCRLSRPFLVPEHLPSPTAEFSTPAETREDLPSNPLHLDTRNSIQDGPTPRQSYFGVEASIDDGKVSPLESDLPRFAQRWSHRAKFISQEYVADCVSTAFETDNDDSGERDAPVTRGREKHRESETPEGAFRKLNSASEFPAEPTGEDQNQDSVSSTENTAPLPPIHQTIARPIRPKKSDSGYGSESSLHNLQRKRTRVAQMVENINEKTQPDTPNDKIDEGIGSESEGSRGLYSMKEVLKKPFVSIPYEANEPCRALPWTPPAKEKKFRSRLSLGNIRRSSPTTQINILPPASPNADMTGSPLDAKKQRKLQKGMPTTLRKKKKIESRVSKQDQSNRSADLPAVPPQMAKSFARRPHSVISSSNLPTASVVEFAAISSAQSALNSPANTTGLASPDLTALPTLHPPSPRLLSKDGFNRSKDDDALRRTFGLTRSSSFGRKRSKSMPRSSFGPNAKSMSVDLRQISCSGGPTDLCCETDQVNPGDGTTPVTDIGSTARVLGSPPYDSGTNQARRRIGVPDAIQHNMHSPHQSESLNPTKMRSSAAVIGTGTSTAEALARAYRGDIATYDQENRVDVRRIGTPQGPRILRPKSAGVRPLATSNNTDLNHFPPSAPLERPLPNSDHFLNGRPKSWYAESIPPMPEIPQEGPRKTGFVSKPVPGVHTADPGPTPAPFQIEDDLSQPIADVIRRARSHYRVRSAQNRAEEPKVEVKEAQAVAMQKFQVPIVSVPGAFPERSRVPESATEVDDDDTHNTFRGSASTAKRGSSAIHWEKHASAWRERRRSIGKSLGHEVDEDGNVVQKSSLAKEAHRSTAISQQPVSAPPSPPKTPAERAAMHAEVYAALIGDDDAVAEENKDNQLATEGDLPRADSANTLPPIPPPKSANRAFPPISTTTTTKTATSTIVTTKSYVTAAATPLQPRDRSPGGRVRTPSGNYHPYRPTLVTVVTAPAASTSRGLTNTVESINTTRSTRPTSTGTNEASTTALVTNPSSILDRYGGGLAYGYAKGAGIFASSAGTRGGPIPPAAGFANDAVEGQRGGTRGRGAPTGVSGLDLSDVPVFLRRVS